MLSDAIESAGEFLALAIVGVYDCAVWIWIMTGIRRREDRGAGKASIFPAGFTRRADIDDSLAQLMREAQRIGKQERVR